MAVSRPARRWSITSLWTGKLRRPTVQPRPRLGITQLEDRVVPAADLGLIAPGS